MSRRTWRDGARLALSAAGLLISAYLTLLHYDSDVPLVCSAGSYVDCETVLSSSASMVLGLPVALWGFLWFAVAFLFAVLSVRARPRGEPPPFATSGLLWTLIGTATVLWLIYQEVGVIGKLCAWCTAVHVLVLAMLVVQVTGEPAERSP